MASENTKIHAGGLNRRVSFFTLQTGRNESGEVVKDSPTLIDRFWVARQDLPGSEDLDGRLVGNSRASFVMRYNDLIFTNGSRMMIRDHDGDFFVSSVSLYGAERQRRRMIKVLAERRDE